MTQEEPRQPGDHFDYSPPTFAIVSYSILIQSWYKTYSWLITFYALIGHTRLARVGFPAVKHAFGHNQHSVEIT